jgi:hypothetical protein
MDTTMISRITNHDWPGCAAQIAATSKAPEHTFDVFFYGLNMDADLLSTKGVVPRNPRLALVEDHIVVLGAKAMLLRSRGGRAYGMLFQLTHREMDTLYAGMHNYRPEPFTVIVVSTDENARPVVAISMVHRDPPADPNLDPVYSARWKDLVRQLGIPERVTATTD